MRKRSGQVHSRESSATLQLTVSLLYQNIYEVYQLMSFRCIMSLSYMVTFLCNVFVQIHYTSESPVRFLFYEKSCKVVYLKKSLKNQ